MTIPRPTPASTRLLLTLLLTVTPTMALGADPDFETNVLPLLKENCTSCHNAKRSSGGVDLTSFRDQSAVKTRYDIWKKVVKQVQSNSMPPDDPLEERTKGILLNWQKATFEMSPNSDPGPPLLRQLTRNEYANTIRDLLRINFDAAGEAGIPQENVVEGFPNRAGSLVLESTVMEKYFTAAELGLEHLFTNPGAAAARKSLLIARPSKDLSAREAARQVLKEFLRRAFRRPPSEREVERYASVADDAIKAGDNFEVAIRKAMKPILVSPHFLLRVESGPKAAGKVERVSDHELAFKTDSTRVITFGYVRQDAVAVPGVTIGYHALSHHGQDEGNITQLKRVERAFFDELKTLLTSLKNTKEGDSTLLDRTTIVVTSNLGSGNSHSNKDLPVLLAGGRFKHGRHLAFDPGSTPLCNLFVSVLNQLGIMDKSFGTSTGTLKGLELI